MTIVLRSDLLNCEINSNMSLLYLQNLGNSVYEKLVNSFNKKFNLNGNTLDDILSHLGFEDLSDYEMVVKYKNVYEFLFTNNNYKDISNISMFQRLLQNATSCNVKVFVNA